VSCFNANIVVLILADLTVGLPAQNSLNRMGELRRRLLFLSTSSKRKRTDAFPFASTVRSFGYGPFSWGFSPRLFPSWQMLFSPFGLVL
jgi:hypothetical protein